MVSKVLISHGKKGNFNPKNSPNHKWYVTHRHASPGSRHEMFITDLKAINNFKITDVDLIIAKDAAKMRAKYKIKLPDALIASSCKFHKCKLITQDEDFKKIKEIEVKSIDKI